MPPVVELENKMTIPVVVYYDAVVVTEVVYQDEHGNESIHCPA